MIKIGQKYEYGTVVYEIIALGSYKDYWKAKNITNNHIRDNWIRECDLHYVKLISDVADVPVIKNPPAKLELPLVNTDYKSNVSGTLYRITRIASNFIWGFDQARNKEYILDSVTTFHCNYTLEQSLNNSVNKQHLPSGMKNPCADIKKSPVKPLSYNHKYEELLAAIHKEEGFTPIKSVLSCKHGKLCKVCNPKSEPYISNVSDFDLLPDV